jgi:hypothetical protein
MCQKPEVVFDIGWQFVKDVVIEPAMETWIFEPNPGYDVWSSEMLADVMRADYVTLDKKEIDAIVSACR